MNINDAFPSNYLKASDLMGKEVEVTIASLEITEMADGEKKPIVSFEGKSKALVLNKTNANTITDEFGPETDSWMGRAITLYPAEVDFQGRRVPAIRLRPTSGPSLGDSADGDIPF